MATLTAAAQAQLKNAISLLVNGTAYETPLSEDVLQRLSPVIDSLGVSFPGKSNFDFAKDTPFSALIGLVWASGVNTLTNAQATALIGAIEYMMIATAHETPFAEDVIQQIAPVAEATHFLTRGGFYEAIRNNPVSTMLKWALQLGS